MTRLVVVCGPPGVGKSRVAEYVRDEIDGTVFRSDVIRKHLFGPEPEYTKEESLQTYGFMFERALELLEYGYSVVLDATFMKESSRETAKKLGEKADGFTMLRVECDPTTTKQRIRNREDDASDADVSVYQSIRDRFEPVDMEHERIDNSGHWNETVTQLDEVLYQ